MGRNPKGSNFSPAEFASGFTHFLVAGTIRLNWWFSQHAPNCLAHN